MRANRTDALLHPISLVKGSVYRDKRGNEWTIREWLINAGCWFEHADDSAATHVWVFDERRKTGKFIRITSFAKSVVEQVCPT